MRSIKQLCAPLSARVMPLSALVGNFGERISRGMALSIQRRLGAEARESVVARQKGWNKPECKTPDCEVRVGLRSRTGMCKKCMHNEFCMCISCRMKRGELECR